MNKQPIDYAKPQRNTLPEFDPEFDLAKTDLAPAWLAYFIIGLILGGTLTFSACIPYF